MKKPDFIFFIHFVQSFPFIVGVIINCRQAVYRLNADSELYAVSIKFISALCRVKIKTHCGYVE
ncbi:hypothetical protein AEGHOMDF_3195 [Methylobacterium soli]|nr:hypothetical protein AEGHOMDF_3195 [Methylobacterium soli]